MAEEKSMAIALIISVIFTGIGILYAGDATKGIIIFVISVVLNILGMFVSMIFSFINIVVWIVGLYLTYKQVQIANGTA